MAGVASLVFRFECMSSMSPLIYFTVTCGNTVSLVATQS